jgi:hypothetical protein
MVLSVYKNFLHLSVFLTRVLCAPIFNFIKCLYYWIVCVQDRGKWKDVVEKAKTFNI